MFGADHPYVNMLLDALLLSILGFGLYVVGARILDHPVTNTGITIVIATIAVALLGHWAANIIRAGLDDLANLDLGRMTP